MSWFIALVTSLDSIIYLFDFFLFSFFALLIGVPAFAGKFFEKIKKMTKTTRIFIISILISLSFVAFLGFFQNIVLWHKFFNKISL